MEVKEYLSMLGKKGGTATRDKYGADHYKEMNRRSVETRRKNKNKLSVDKSFDKPAVKE